MGQLRSVIGPNYQHQAEYRCVLFAMTPEPRDVNSRTGKKSELPLVQLRLVAPFVEELERQRMTSAGVLTEFNLEREKLRDESLYVTAATMYRLVERLSETSGDPHFGVHVGSQMDLRNWPPTEEAARKSGTVGEYLLRFMEKAGEQENTATFALNTVGQRTTFRLRRVTDTGIEPRHNDGFTIAYLLNIICPAVGEAFDGSKVLAKVCDPKVIPARYLGIRTATSDTLGAQINFPSYWLTRKLADTRTKRLPTRGPAIDFPASNLVDAFRFAILPYIHDTKLNADRAASICGMKRRTLARKLQQAGTSVTELIQDLKRSKAEQELLETRKTVKAIALDVGYTDPIVFSRAFKRWTGETPSEFRDRAQSV